MSVVPEFAPGCFGSFLAFRENDMICSRCPFASDCGLASNETRAQIEEKYGIKIKKRGEKKQSADDLSALPLKVQEVVRQIRSKNIDVAQILRGEGNPFDGRMPSAKIVCAILITVDRPIEQKVITGLMAKRMNWREETARVQTRVMLQALEFLGVIKRVSGNVVLMKEA